MFRGVNYMWIIYSFSLVLIGLAMTNMMRLAKSAMVLKPNSVVDIYSSLWFLS